MTTKRFHIGAILTVTTGTVLATLREIQDLLEWMVDERVLTSQIDTVVVASAPFLKKTFPDLAVITELPDHVDQTEKGVREWLSTLGEQYRDVPRLPSPPVLNPLQEPRPNRVILIGRSTPDEALDALAPRDEALDVLARWLLAKGQDREDRDREMDRLTTNDRSAVIDRMEWIRSTMCPENDTVLRAVESLTSHYLKGGS